MPKHAAIYVRVSTVGQNLEAQEPDLVRWAGTHAQPVKWYRDHATGRQMERPEMDKLMDAVRAGKVDRIIVWRLDRLGRRVRQLCKLYDDLREHGVDLISLRDGLTLNTPAGRMHAQILASVAEFENEIRQERIQAGIALARERQARARELHAQGMSVPLIVATLGGKATEEIVTKMLAAKPGRLYWGGIGRGKHAREATKERVRELFLRNGLKPEDIAKILKVSNRTVWRRIEAMGGIKALRASKHASKAAVDAPERFPPT